MACRVATFTLWIVTPWIVFFAALAARADDAQQRAGLDLFESRVRPALVQHCYKCHASDSKQVEGELLLDSREATRRGGASGPAVVPGKVDESLLVEAIRYESFEMPPSGKLPQDVIDDFVRWIELGAPDPRGDQAAAAPAPRSIDVESGRSFWAFQPPRDVAVPPVADSVWPRGAIDRFIAARLEAEKLRPNPQADRASLVRRLYFDLTGMPPSPVELAEGLALDAPDWHVRLVDRLLASPRFGEHWGRHWLDLARYSESTGGGRSSPLPEAHRYRDYVIRSLNADKPFDRFLREQVAGDLLAYATRDERWDNLIATGFLAIGPKNLDSQDKEQLRMDTVDEQIDTVGKVFMALTLGCARCHDHKFDPVPTRDYYALAGVFRGTLSLVRDNISLVHHQPLPVDEQWIDAVTNHSAQIKDFEKRIEAARKVVLEERKIGPENPASRAELERLRAERDAAVAAAPPPLPRAVAVTDESETGDYFVCVRGDARRLGDPVERGFVQVAMPADSPPVEIASGESGRRELADWLASRDHPLTARVYVNRVWHHLFGAGLVRTVDNFGAQGERPSHPELLDHLASRLVDGGWSTKGLVREIVLSGAYAQSAAGQDDAIEVDPQTRLIWRHPRRRMTGEMLRDAILSASGQLESIVPDAALPQDAVDSSLCRSAYLPVLREEGCNALLEVFDAAHPGQVVGERSTSTVPTQSLFLLNSRFVYEQAAAAAARLLATGCTAPEEQIERAFVLTLSRPPSAAERAAALELLSREQTDVAAPSPLARLFHGLFASVDFRYVE